jgi:hypothetical protein
MEDVLEVYARPRHPRRPLVCFDETNKEQHREVVAPLPVVAGHPARYESTYERNGVSNIFMCFAPLENWRHVKVTDHRKAVDWAQCMQELVDVHFPDVECIVDAATGPSSPSAFVAARARREEDRRAQRLGHRHAVHSTDALPST